MTQFRPSDVIAGLRFGVIEMLTKERNTMSTTQGWCARTGSGVMRLTTTGVIAWTSVALIVISQHPQCIEQFSWLWNYTGIFGLTAGVGLSEAQRRRERAQKARLEACVRDALTDPLTGLGNRRVLQSELDRTLHGPGERCWLMLIDIDNFKDVNDTHGHRAGDQVLQAVSQTLQSCARSTDVLSRFGGEEFAILARHSSFAGVLRHAGQIRERVAATRCRHDNAVLRVTCSIGFARARTPISAAALVEQADQALYLAKGAGRNRCAWHDGTATALVHASATLPRVQLEHRADTSEQPQPPSWNRSSEAVRLPFVSLQRSRCASSAGVS